MILLSSVCLLFTFSTNLCAKDEWKPVSPSELSMKHGKVDPDADAEAIFWDIKVNDAGQQKMIMDHYIRLKIFTERGREKFSKVDIPFVKGLKIKDIKARVIKPDGTIVELEKKDIFEREIVKTNALKIKAKSFAVPNIEKGVIVEYRYKEVHKGSSAEDMRMVFQRDIPMQNVTYYFKPFKSVKYLTFNLSGNKFVKGKKGFYRATMSNVPALKEEPQMPPLDQVRSWLLVYYLSRRNLKRSSTDFWSRVAGAMIEVYEIKDTLKPGKKMKLAAAEIIKGASSNEDKIRKLYDFCKTKVKNIDFDTKITDEEKDKIKINSNDYKTYKILRGRSHEINKLFASLADAAGFEARIAFTGDRSKLFFNTRKAHESFIHMAGVGIKINGRWKYFDPGSPFLPYGHLVWYEENTPVFLMAYKDYITTKTPLSLPKDAVKKRTGRFTLSENGTLEGTVEIKFTGHFSYRQKMNNYDVSANKREEFLKDSVKKLLSTAELSKIAIENVTDPEKPFTYKYNIKVPNYAQKTGKRIFLKPGVFEYGSEPRFSSATRKYDIYFHYPWSEKDDITIKLPKGFVLDNADTPNMITDRNRIGMLDIKMSIDRGSNTLAYKRNFYFGGGNLIFFRSSAYKPLKDLFDSFHKANNHLITLKKEIP